MTAITRAVQLSPEQPRALLCRRVCPPRRPPRRSHSSPGVPCSRSYNQKALGLSLEAEHRPPTPGRCRQQPQNPDAVNRSRGRAPGDPALCSSDNLPSQPAPSLGEEGLASKASQPHRNGSAERLPAQALCKFCHGGPRGTSSYRSSLQEACLTVLKVAPTFLSCTWMVWGSKPV